MIKDIREEQKENYKYPIKEFTQGKSKSAKKKTVIDNEKKQQK